MKLSLMFFWRKIWISVFTFGVCVVWGVLGLFFWKPVLVRHRQCLTLANAVAEPTQ